jgi:predicted metalloprotease with PDZ domain
MEVDNFLFHNSSLSLRREAFKVKSSVHQGNMNINRRHFWILFACCWSLCVQAQNSAPEAQPILDTIPPARDIAYSGTVNESVDATDITQGIFSVQETFPVSAGPLTLLYPQWIPGYHSPGGQIPEVAGIKFLADGRPLIWHRDPVYVFAFHVDIPDGVTNLVAQFQFLAPTDATQGRIVTTPDMLNVEWHAVVLYPAGYYVRRIKVAAALTLPDGWRAVTALEPESQDGATIHFKPVNFDTLVDSPVFAGANVRVETLAPGVHLDMVADQPEQLAATDEQIQLHRNLVTQAVKLFGAQHYDHYDFLLALSDRQGGIGLEHHRSSENGVSSGYFTKWDDNLTSRQLLPHEYTHSWNGKFRRPYDLWTPDYRTPMQDDLLWVYEGQTQFWGIVLAARSGLLTKDETLGCLAGMAAWLDAESGRQWRSLEDTTTDPVMADPYPKAWHNWQRGADYYNESVLIWLDADSIIREGSQGQRSMDDFARAFFGVRDRDWGELTYNFDDIVQTLNQVQTNDWAAFLRQRLDTLSGHAPLDGLTRSGYRLIYTNEPTAWFKAGERSRQNTDLTYSGGFTLGKDGAVTDVLWDSPAFNAGLTVGSTLIAVNNQALDPDRLKADIKARKSPINLLVKTGDIYRTLRFDYTGGLRYPRLEKIGTGPSGLDDLLAPKS